MYIKQQHGEGTGGGRCPLFFMYILYHINKDLSIPICKIIGKILRSFLKIQFLFCSFGFFSIKNRFRWMFLFIFDMYRSKLLNMVFCFAKNPDGVKNRYEGI
jgi:hypothetical protein